MKKSSVYFPILEAEIARRGIKKKDIASSVGMEQYALYHKINGDRGFTLDEAIMIQETWFPDIPVNELFKHENDV